MDFVNRFCRILSIILVIFFALSILIHTNINLDQDLGRHIKTGEIIWQTKSIPKVNLFSYTYPNYPFVNHHWGSEVIFYLFSSNFGFLSITYLKIIVIFIAVLSIFYASRKISNPATTLISLTLFLPLLMSRTDERPEIFGFLFFCLFLAIFIKFKQDGYKGRIVWLIPFVQLLWTNMHITFIYGFLLIFLFFVDACFNLKFLKSLKLLKLLIISTLLSLLNPNGLSGLLYPLNVFKNYGYTIAENQNLFFLSSLTSNIFIKIFWLQSTILIIFGLISFFLSLKCRTLKKDFIFYLLSGIYCLLSIFMLRNFPFFVFTAIVSFSYFIKNIFLYINSQNADSKHHGPHASPRLRGAQREVELPARRNVMKAGLHVREDAFKNLLYLGIIIFSTIFIYLITSNTFYNTFDLNKKFGLGVQSSYEKGVNFFIENKLPGPIFNNFDIGGYLDYRLFELCEERGFEASWPARKNALEPRRYPELAACARRHVRAQLTDKVFVDNRPEAYPASFFEEYKAAQIDIDKMKALLKKYKIRSIIFSHTDGTQWAEIFVSNIKKLDGYKLVYLDESVLILTEKDFSPRRLDTVTQGRRPWEREEFFGAKTADYHSLLHLARFYHLTGENKLSLEAIQKAYQKNPLSCSTRLSYGVFLAQDQNLFIKNNGISILKSTWYCPFPQSIKNSLTLISP